MLDSFTLPTLDYLWLSTMQGWSELASALGRTDVCESIFAELESFRGRLGIVASGSVCIALVSRTLGQLALATERIDLAIELLDETVAQADSIGAPFESTTARRYLAQALIRSDVRRDELAAILATATELADRHGFAGERAELATLTASLA